VRRRSLVLLIIACNVILGLIAFTQASRPIAAQTTGTAPALFTDAPDAPEPPLNDTATRARAVRLEIETLRSAAQTGERLLLTPFDDVRVTALFTPAQPHPLIAGGSVWTGEIDGGGEIVIVSAGGDTRGSFKIGARVFTLLPASGGTFIIEERGVLIDEGDDIRIPPPPPLGIAPAPDLSLDSPNAVSQIDWMVAYTDDFRALLGGTTQAVNLITAELALINQAYTNSSINISLRLVHTVEVAYDESNDMENALDHITITNDGNLDMLPTLRNTYSADLVTLAMSNGSYGGIAWLMSSGYIGNPLAFAPNGYSVINRSAMGGNHSTAHELGHNMGLMHDRANSGSSVPLQPYGYGWQYPAGGFRTIMAYSCAGGACPRINRFSSATQLYSGNPMGNANNDAVRTLNFSAPYVAQFRVAPVVNTPTPTPTRTPTRTVTLTPTPTRTPTRTVTLTPTPTRTPTVATTTLTIAMQLQGRPVAPHSSWNIPVRVIVETSGGVVLFDDTVTIEPNGTTIVSNLAPGAITVWVKGTHTLGVTKQITLVPGANTLTTSVLREGDASNDNIVNITDFSILAATFGKTISTSGFDGRADFNEDNTVNISDFSLLAANFGQSGASAP